MGRRCGSLVLLILALVLVDVRAGHTQTREYFPVTIDRLLTDPHTYVSVTGKVIVVTMTDDGTPTFRLADSRGRQLSCLLEKGSRLQPRVGQVVTVTGVKSVIVRADRPAVVEIDPVHTIVPLEH